MEPRFRKNPKPVGVDLGCKFKQRSPLGLFRQQRLSGLGLTRPGRWLLAVGRGERLQAAGQDPIQVGLEDTGPLSGVVRGWWPWPRLPLAPMSITELPASPGKGGTSRGSLCICPWAS